MSNHVEKSMSVLYKMLEYKRPHGSKHEEYFIDDFLIGLDLNQDKKGNLYKIIGDPNEVKVMWSSHTDTVHYKDGFQQIKKVGGNIYSDSNCLGADDTAGVWLMYELIKANKPGLYIFHREEEIGTIGSKFIAKNHPEVFQNIDFAIALDRKGTNSVITHQIGSRCCSDEFAASFGLQVPGFKADPNGVYTDTVNYVKLVNECTNISVGYYDQHSSKERLNYGFISGLRDSLINLDYSKLVCKRDKTVVEPYRSSYFGSGYGYEYDDNFGGYDENSWRNALKEHREQKKLLTYSSNQSQEYDIDFFEKKEEDSENETNGDYVGRNHSKSHGYHGFNDANYGSSYSSPIKYPKEEEISEEEEEIAIEELREYIIENSDFVASIMIQHFDITKEILEMFEAN